MTWLYDDGTRVLRTIQNVVDKVKDATEDAVGVWKRITAVLDVALMPHPEARVAVMRAIEEEFILRDTG